MTDASDDALLQIIHRETVACREGGQKNAVAIARVQTTLQALQGAVTDLDEVVSSNVIPLRVHDLEGRVSGMEKTTLERRQLRSSRSQTIFNAFLSFVVGVLLLFVAGAKWFGGSEGGG